jgi:uncharacterized membrane protein YkvA (DUF1232 family)
MIFSENAMAVQRLKARARLLRRDTYAVYLACRDPRTPWYAKTLAAAVAAYAFSPIDLIPDFIPVLGYLDDLIIVPAGIALAIKLIPAPVMAEARERARLESSEKSSRTAALIVIAIWITVAFVAGYLVLDQIF